MVFRKGVFMGSCVKNVFIHSFCVFLLLCVVLFCCSNAYAYDSFDNLKYDIKFSFSNTGHFITAKETISFNCEAPLSEIHLHFYPAHKWSDEEKDAYEKYGGYFNIDTPFPDGFDENKAGVNFVSVNGRRAQFSLKGKDRTLLVIYPDAPLSGSIVLDIDFEFYVPKRIGRFGRNNGVYSIYRAYPILDVMKDGKWLDYPDYLLYQPYVSQSALYDVAIELPESFVLAASGQAVASEKRRGSVLYKISSDKPLRDFSFFFSKKYRVYTKNVDGIDIKVYYLPSAPFDAVMNISKFIEDELMFYKGYGFEYPYGQISVVPVYLGYGGNETSNVVMLDRRVLFIPNVAKRYQEFLAVHEFGHQFWFNQVGSDEYAEPFVDEAVNSYFVQKYLEEKYGHNCNVLTWPWPLDLFMPNFTFLNGTTVRYRYLARRGIDLPVLMQANKMNEPDMIFAFAYGKGEALFETMEHSIGKKATMSIFKDYFKRYRFAIADVNALEDVFSRHLDNMKLDASDRFASVLRDKGIDFYAKKTRNGFRILERSETLERVKVRYRLNRQWLMTDVKSGDVLHADKIVIDPDDEVLETDEANNVYPVYDNVDFKLKPLNLPFYSMDIFNTQKRLTADVGFNLSEFGPGVRFNLHYPFVYDLALGGYIDTAQDERSITSSFRLHGIDETLWEMALEYAYRDDYSEYDENSEEIRLSFSLPLQAPSFRLGKTDDFFELYMAKNREWFSQIDGMFDKVVSSVYYDVQDLFYVGFGIQRSVAEDFLIRAYYESGFDKLGADFSFNRLYCESIYGFKYRDLDFSARVGLGLSDADNKPMFFAGGSNGLRAYRRKAIRGGNLALFSVQAFKNIYEADDSLARQNGYVSVSHIKTGVFFDVGKVWQDSMSENRWKKDIGIGFRVGLNFGALASSADLRLDFANSIGEDDDESRIVIGFGSRF